MKTRMSLSYVVGRVGDKSVTIETLRSYFPRIGRIGMGFMTDTKADGTKAKRPFPARTETFVFHADDEDRAKEVARVFGGDVAEAISRDEEGGRWRVITKAKEIEFFLPTDDERSVDFWMEKWNNLGVVRRCTGNVCVMAVVDSKPDPQTGEVVKQTIRNVPCLCEQENAHGEDACDTTTRMNVVIPVLKDAPGLGVWQVQSRGRGTCQAIKGSIELLQALRGSIALTPLILVAGMKRVQYEEDGQTKSMSVPQMSIDTTRSMGQYVEEKRSARALIDVPDVDRNQPVIGALPAPKAKESTEVPTGAVNGDADGSQPRPTALAPADPIPNDQTATTEQRSRLWEYAKGLGITKDEARYIVKTHFNKPSTEGMTVAQLAQVKDIITKFASGREKK